MPLSVLIEEESQYRQKETLDELLPESLFIHKYPLEITLQAKHVFLKYIALST